MSFIITSNWHDVVLANGLPVESYLDAGDRVKFAGEVVTTLYPEFAARTWEMVGCAPLVLRGPALAQVRERLSSRARPGIGVNVRSIDARN